MNTIRNCSRSSSAECISGPTFLLELGKPWIKHSIGNVQLLIILNTRWRFDIHTSAILAHYCYFSLFWIFWLFWLFWLILTILAILAILAFLAIMAILEFFIVILDILVILDFLLFWYYIRHLTVIFDNVWTKIDSPL